MLLRIDDIVSGIGTGKKQKQQPKASTGPQTDDGENVHPLTKPQLFIWLSRWSLSRCCLSRGLKDQEYMSMSVGR